MSRSLPFQALVASLAATPVEAGLVRASAEAGLRRDVRVAGACLSFGPAWLDDRLGGGLAEAALHEIHAGSEADIGAATGFALLLALRCGRPGPLVWLRDDRARMNGRPYGLGLAGLGLDPARLLLVQAPDTLAVLRAGAEAVQCGAVGVVVIEPWGKSPALDLTATRRLALAAARSGVLTLLLRSGEARPSAAQSRWGVKAALSEALAANAPGHPAFDISLLRHRGGIAGFETRLEWNRDRRVFCRAAGEALPGAVPAAAVQRAGAPGRVAEWRERHRAA